MASKQSIIEAELWPIKLIHWLFCSIDKLWAEKVEKVERPPQNPIIMSCLYASDINTFCKIN